jgi:pSer/pThr/pTyr-binding forkhead associated (FHA) protein
MSNTLVERLQRPRPALVVKYGNTDKRFLPLDKSGTVLGRSRGCDFELNAPEVSAVHCVITRDASGLYVRDCQSRAGTQVNGERVQESPLRDGDVLQLGSFSFEVRLPSEYMTPGKRTGAENPGRILRLVDSRRRFAKLALRLRRRLRDERRAHKEESSEVLAEMFRERVRQYEQKLARLQDTERALAEDRETLRREWARVRSRTEEAERQAVVH